MTRRLTVSLLLLMLIVSASDTPAAQSPQAAVKATPTPTPTGVKATVEGATLKVRRGPATTFSVTASAMYRQSFDVQGKTRDGA